MKRSLIIVAISALFALDGMQPKVPRGIKNLGATCYMNSVLQCLYQIEPLTHFVLSAGKDYYKPETVAMEYVNLIHRIVSETGLVVTKEFCKPVFEHFFYIPTLEGGSIIQQDAHEFLTKILGRLSEEDVKENKKTIIKQTLGRFNVVPPAPLKTPVALLFTSTLQSTLDLNISKLETQYNKTREAHQVLLVGIEKNTNFATQTEYQEYKKKHSIEYKLLDTCLTKFFVKEALPESEWYSVITKGKMTPVPTYKQYKILSPAPFLVITLKRNLILGKGLANLFGLKLNHGVSFPLKGLDIKPYVDNNYKDNTLYDLIGVVEQSGIFIKDPTTGKFISGGHYTAYVKHKNQWYYCDDSAIVPITDKEIQVVADSGLDNTFTPYILFYRKRTLPVAVPSPSALAQSRSNKDVLASLRAHLAGLQNILS